MQRALSVSCNERRSGGFATVWLARRKSDGKTLAVKKIECENFDDANQALTEGKMLLELDHHHVIKYYDFFLQQEKGGGAPRGGKMFVVLVMSYAPDGDLFTKLERAHKEQRHIPGNLAPSLPHVLNSTLYSQYKTNATSADVCGILISAEETIRKWLYQLCQALVYVGGKNIIHRDIKLANVLVDGDTLKLGAGAAPKLKQQE